MDVPEDVEEGANRSKPVQQLEAAHVAGRLASPGRGQIPVPVGRSVGDDDIGIVGDRLPLPADRRAAVPHEVPVQESRRVGRAEETEAFNLDGLVDEEPDAVGGKDFAKSRLVVLHGTVVIPRRDDLVPVRQGTHPGGEIADFPGSATSAEVPGMDENVTVRNGVLHGGVHPVGVADRDDGEASDRHGSILAVKGSSVPVRWFVYDDHKSFDDGHRDLVRPEAEDAPAAQARLQILLQVGVEPGGPVVPAIDPDSPLNLDQATRRQIRKIGPPTPLGVEAVFPLQFRSPGQSPES